MTVRGLIMKKGIKANSEPVGESLIFLILSYFFIHIFLKAFGWLLYPFKDKDPDAIKREYESSVEQKQQARNLRYDTISKDINDPMYQFYERNVENPELYVDDNNNNNDYYLAWFLKWKRGEVLDSNLRWAPPIYDFKEDMQYNFLLYLNNQLKLHENAVIGSIVLLSTLGRFYPEFDASSFKTVREDLEAYTIDVERSKVIEELRGEINKYGLSEYIADYLIENVSSENIPEIASRIKRALEHGYDESTCIYLAEHAIEPDTSVAECIGKVTLEATCFTPEVAHLYACGKLTIEDLKDMKDFFDAAEESLGLAIYMTNDDGIVPFEELLKDKLKKYQRKNLSVCIMK